MRLITVQCLHLSLRNVSYVLKIKNIFDLLSRHMAHAFVLLSFQENLCVTDVFVTSSIVEII